MTGFRVSVSWVGQEGVWLLNSSTVFIDLLAAEEHFSGE
ncbi:hypothetical protein PFLCHA0_c54910 [Pseudomonas protegens CHA0]|jgi:hypothetical protein|uniref:Uncharacterized protein n=1 Tax=Pseudomonas protegens (strain DSM 19095 / LMG 27888 / CFBP 6595 / CHA0) TaxID=1124983 RepID=A0A2C9EUE4_PSEPH|nr:hypothetical protein PFLCHA0_c54910 [Pseudomonas protegens CHA0]